MICSYVKSYKFLLLLFLSFGCLDSVFSQKLLLKGSDSVLPLGQKMAEQFMKSNKNVNISVVGGGSGVGIAALVIGTTQIAMTSRPIKMDEKLKLKEAGRLYKEVKIAYDALSIVVHPGNKVTQLTREQIEGIFTGKIKNWKEVGGDDMKIVAYARETSSGTYEFFKEHLLNRKNYTSACLNMPASGAVVQSVSQTKGAIGFVGLAYIDKSVKAIGVSIDQGKTFIKPSLATAKNKTYPIVRPLYFYYLTKSEATVKPFIDYVIGKTGQGLVSQIGYISVDEF
jgi:phosphate transport system substrate-binding protein